MRRAWIVLVAVVALTLVFAPSREPALPEPGAARIIRAVFEGER